MIKLTLQDGRAIYFAPEHIACINEYGLRGSLVYISGVMDDAFCVMETPEEIIKQLPHGL
ncbi:hypothetical protein J27TS7_57810 [Paenibacillus dendritiformis]|nr:hypothetical protein J27TS7_57810 [Paenibacillus dendritiformis]